MERPSTNMSEYKYKYVRTELLRFISNQVHRFENSEDVRLKFNTTLDLDPVSFRPVLDHYSFM